MGALKERFEAIVKLATDNPKIIAVSSVAVVLLAVLAISGGGSNEQQVETGADGSTLGDDFGLGDGGEGVEGEGPDASGGSGSSGPGGASGGSGGSGGGGGGLPPITDTTVKVGISYLEDPGTANQAAGFAGIGQVDQRRGWEAMLKEINKAKPGGRSAVPVWYSFTTNEVLSKGAEQIAAEQCALWTQDDPVFAVYAGSAQTTLNGCLTKAGVAQMGGGAGFSYDQTWKDYPYLVEHNASALDRMAEDQIDQLEAYGYFDTCGDDPSVQPCKDGAPRIALIRYDQPSHKAAAKRMKSTLAKHGRQLCSGCEFEITYSDDDIGEQLDDATEVNSAINNCRLPTHSAPGAPNGPCTHMLFLGSIAGVRITLFYVQRAEDQEYRAKLGFNRMDAPAAVRDFYDNAGQPQYKNQFDNSVIVSYAPSDFNLQPGAFQDCVKLFEDAGESFEGAEGSNRRGQIPGYCDTAWYHIASFSKAGRSLSVNSWLNGVANTGQVKSAGTFIMRTTSTRRDGAGAVRIGDWDAGGACNCWKPVTGNIPV